MHDVLCMNVYVCVCMYTILHVCMQEPEVDIGCLPQLFFTLTLLSLNLRFTSRMVTLLSLPPQCWNCRYTHHTWLFHGWWGSIWFQCLWLLSKHFTDWVIFPVPNDTFSVPHLLKVACLWWGCICNALLGLRSEYLIFLSIFINKMFSNCLYLALQAHFLLLREDHNTL